MIDALQRIWVVSFLFSLCASRYQEITVAGKAGGQRVELNGKMVFAFIMIPRVLRNEVTAREYSVRLAGASPIV